VKRRNILIAVVVAIILLVVGWFVWRTWLASQPVACTMEARLCPDGTAVGRVPPNCDFAPCPGE